LLKKTINLYNQFKKVKFSFKTPIKKKILLFDGFHSDILREIIKQDFDILKVRDDKVIYFWIFLKQIIFLDFRFNTYCKNYIKFISPKILITLIDTNIDFYILKNNFRNIQFISIQNGVRTLDWFKSKRVKISKNLKCDHIFVFNKHYLKEYQKIIDSNYHVMGNFKNNIVELNKTKNNKNFLLISELGFGFNNEIYMNNNKKLFNFINLYMLKNNKKIYILLKSKNTFLQQKEIYYYKKIFQSNCIFQKSSEWKESYKILDKFQNIIFMWSTLGYEAIARKKKIVAFSPNRVKGYKYHFGWPATYKKNYNFFTPRNFTYIEIARVLDRISKCSQVNWEKQYYKTIKDQFYLDKNNSKLKKIISELL